LICDSVGVTATSKLANSWVLGETSLIVQITSRVNSSKDKGLPKDKPHRGSLEGATLYVTLEPCPMCAGALVMTKCDALVYGARDPKAGACHSLYRITEDDRLNHRVKVTGGIMADDAKFLLSEFFKTLRKEKK